MVNRGRGLIANIRSMSMICFPDDDVPLKKVPTVCLEMVVWLCSVDFKLKSIRLVYRYLIYIYYIRRSDHVSIMLVVPACRKQARPRFPGTSV